MTLDIPVGLHGLVALRTAMVDYQQGQESATTLQFASDIAVSQKCATENLVKVRRTLCIIRNCYAVIIGKVILRLDGII